MFKSEVKAINEKHLREIERKLNETGYTKVSDCMWAKIYTKGNIEIVVTREY